MAITIPTSSLLEGYAPSIIFATLAVLLIIYQRLQPVMDPREPPIQKPTFPLIGHLLGMIRYQVEYFPLVTAKSPYPDYTLPILSSKTYVITSPALIQSCLSKKTLLFEPFVREFAARQLLIAGKSLEIVRRWAPEPDGKGTYLIDDFHNAVHKGLARGEGLDKMNAVVLNRIAGFLGRVLEEGGGVGGDGVEIGSFYLWIRDEMTKSICASIFGDNTPFEDDPNLLKAVWDFESYLPLLLVNVLPSLTARTGHKARALLQRTLQKYYNSSNDTHPSAGSIVTLRAASMRAHDLPSSEIGRFEISLIHAATANAIPMGFWLLCRILSDAKLHAEIAREVEGMVETTVNGQGETEWVINKSLIASKCPLLESAYQETLRFDGTAVSTRVVVEDTIVSDGEREYLLKKDGVVQVPAAVTQTAEEIWGDEAKVFDARRFLRPDSDSTSVNGNGKNGKNGSANGKATVAKSPKRSEAETARLQRRALIPFGGGRNLCPGRHFAYAEIVGMAALMSVAFEVDGVYVPDGGGERKVQFASATYAPLGKAKEGMKVRMRGRRHALGEVGRWRLVTGESKVGKGGVD